ncbi:MAG: GatB/YqeY domain-containing protein [Lachnospiraceae bacterium]|nr:GatB/YqeY domain-containing protein [Lachnospiraceae bacterium]
MQFEVLQKSMIDAMKARDKARKDSISVLVSAAKKAAIDAGCREAIPETMVDQAVLKEIKSVKEQIDSCPASREDLLTEYKARLAVFEEFAPKLLSAEEVEAILKEKFSDVLASGNKGAIMKAVMPELKGKADGKVINEVVAKLTSGN